MLFSAQVLLALGNAFADTIYDEEFASNTTKKSSKKFWGIFEGGNSFIDGISAIIGGILVSFFGFNFLIYTMAITATISFMLIVYYIRKVRSFK